MFLSDEICPLPVQFPTVKPDPDRANPKIGVSMLAFSSDSRFLATKNGETTVGVYLHVEINKTDHCLNSISSIVQYCSSSQLCMKGVTLNPSFSPTVDNAASVVWVWDMQKMSLVSVLEQTSSVRCFQWDPLRPRLALCTGNTKLYLWSPSGCVSVPVATEGKHTVVRVLTVRDSN